MDRWITDGFDYYQQLAVTDDATPDDLRRAYKSLAALFHPDRNSGAKPDVREIAEVAMARVNVAYDVLSDPELRRSYDEWRQDSGHARRTTPSRPVVKVNPQNIDFGSITIGDHRQQRAQIVNHGGDYVDADFNPKEAAWWTAWSEGPNVDDEVTLSWLVIETRSGGTPGKHTSTVTVRLDDSMAVLTVRANLVSPPSAAPVSPRTSSSVGAPRRPAAPTAPPTAAATARTAGPSRVRFRPLAALIHRLTRVLVPVLIGAFYAGSYTFSSTPAQPYGVVDGLKWCAFWALVAVLLSIVVDAICQRQSTWRDRPALVIGAAAGLGAWLLSFTGSNPSLLGWAFPPVMVALTWCIASFIRAEWLPVLLRACGIAVALLIAYGGMATILVGRGVLQQNTPGVGAVEAEINWVAQRIIYS